MSKKYPPQQLHIRASQPLQDTTRAALHVPVLLEPVLKLLDPGGNESYLDLTAGYGGHATAIVAGTKAAHKAVLVDRDRNAIEYLRSKPQLKSAHLLHQDFASAATQLVADGSQFDMILIDLGVSSPQLDNAERGFSFKYDSLLDMRMDQRLHTSAHHLINSLSVKELGQLIRDYGEENPRHGNRIAQAIVAHRPIDTSRQLAEIIKQQHRGKWSKVHPATRTFQALRIAVNDELGQIERTLPLLPDLLHPGGRLAVISFHSLEDRLVKQFLKNQTESGYEASMRLLNKKPISGAKNFDHNPRARSAKLRGAVKINTKRKDLHDAN